MTRTPTPLAPAPERGRTILALAYFFPPLGGGGTQRTAKYLKYLPDHGYGSIVVTTRAKRYPVQDPTLLRDIPAGTLVYRAPELPLWKVKWRLQGVLRRLGLPTAITEYVGWPDEMAGWLPGAAWLALRLARRHRPDVVYTTSSPVSAHIVGYMVQRLTGLPWVADFRDGWTRNPWAARVTKPLGAVNQRAERAILATATRVVVAAESVELAASDGMNRPVTVIPNGVDEHDVRPASVADTPPFRFSYVGSLYGEYNCAPVFIALRKLLDSGSLQPGDVEIRLVGQTGVPRDLIDGLPVVSVGYVDHPTAVAEMTSAHALLFHVPPSSNAPSAKIYEYLVSGRPILCVARPENLGSRLVSDLGAGPCVRPDDIAGVANAIEDLVARWRIGELRVSPSVREEALRRFSRRVLAGELAAVLDEAIDAHSGSGGLRPSQVAPQC